MISRKQLEEIENYLFSASLNDIPNVLGRVMPMLFSEMRVMMDLLDTRTEDFFNGRRVQPGSGSLSSQAADGRSEFLGDQTSTPEPSRPSSAEVSASVRFAEEEQSPSPERGGVSGTEGADPPSVDGGGSVVAEVGGTVRGKAGVAGESSVRADREEPVKRKRGRPRKNQTKE